MPAHEIDPSTKWWALTHPASRCAAMKGNKALIVEAVKGIEGMATSSGMNAHRSGSVDGTSSVEVSISRIRFFVELVAVVPHIVPFASDNHKTRPRRAVDQFNRFKPQLFPEYRVPCSRFPPLTPQLLHQQRRAQVPTIQGERFLVSLNRLRLVALLSIWLGKALSSQHRLRALAHIELKHLCRDLLAPTALLKNPSSPKQSQTRYRRQVCVDRCR